MKSINSRLNRILISSILGVPSYAVFALIRNFPFSKITLYAYVEYSLSATISFLLIFELQNLKSKWLNELVSWHKNWRLRLFIEFLSSLLITASIVYLGYSFLYKVIWESDIFIPSLYFYISLVFFISLCFMAFVNAVPLIEEWKKSILKTEVLEKENISAKMEALRTQLSPHFFFNNLSILNGLINDNPKGAKKFTTKFSEVFRYILLHKNDEIVSLLEEMKFLKDYIYLLETRFKNKFKVTVSKLNYEFWIPPVTLQQLIENAIKHNEASFKKPLEIKIWQENDYLVIENNRQPKKTMVESTRIGLTNINQRFELLTTEKIIYSDLNDKFSVKIPLITNYESIDNRG